MLSFSTVGSGVCEAQVSLPRGQLLLGHTFGKQSLGIFIRERRDDHDLVAALGQTQEQGCVLITQAGVLDAALKDGLTWHLLLLSLCSVFDDKINFR